MKKTISGMPAFNIMLTNRAPEKTRTYTPIRHADIISQTRKEIGKAGFKILGDNYRCTANAQVAIGTYRVEYKHDPDIELMVAFMNSYDTTYAFRFAIGANVKGSENSLFVNDRTFGFYKKFHKGDAAILATANIADILMTADKYWDSLVSVKDKMKSISLTNRQISELLGRLFFFEDMLTGFQMNIIKSEMNKPSFDYGDKTSLWSYFNHITAALKEAHPTEWMEHHTVIFDLLNEEFDLVDAEIETEEIPEDLVYYAPIHQPLPLIDAIDVSFEEELTEEQEVAVAELNSVLEKLAEQKWSDLKTVDGSMINTVTGEEVVANHV